MHLKQNLKWQSLEKCEVREGGTPNHDMGGASSLILLSLRREAKRLSQMTFAPRITAFSITVSTSLEV